MSGERSAIHDKTQNRTALRFVALRAYGARWRELRPPARLYLLHAALLTCSLAIYGLFFNLVILALGYPRTFLGQLNGLGIAVAAVFSVPLWWLVTRIGFQRALIANALLLAGSALIVAFTPSTLLLLIATGLTGIAATILQVSAPPFMMQHSDDATRDHLFSANQAINIGVAGIGSLLGGGLPAWFGRLLGVGVESATAYRATFAVAGAGLLLSLAPLLLIRRYDSPPIAPLSDPQPTPVPEPVTPTPPAAPLVWLARLPLLGPIFFRLPQPLQAIIRQPGPVIQLLIPPLLISFGAALLIQYLNLFFKERFPISDSVLGAIFAGLGIVTGLAALVGPALSTRIGKIRTIVLTQLLSIPFLLALGFVPVLGIAVGAALVRGALFNMGAPLYDAFAMERTDEAARSFVIGLINGAYTVGYLVAPFVSVWVQQRYGFAPLFVATAVFYGLAALANIALFLRRTKGG